MKGWVLVPVYAVVSLSVLAAGCMEAFNKWPSALNFTPPKQASSPPPSESSSGYYREAHEAAAAPAKETVKKATASQAQGAAETTVPPSITNSTVTLSDDDATKTRAEQLLANTNLKLAKVDRSKLTGQQATAYEQAAGFADAARKALEQRDYLAASGLAEKASLLADKVAPSTSLH